MQRSSWKVIPENFTQSFPLIPGTGGRAGIEVLRCNSISGVYDKFKDILLLAFRHLWALCDKDADVDADTDVDVDDVNDDDDDDDVGDDGDTDYGADAAADDDDSDGSGGYGGGYG